MKIITFLLKFCFSLTFVWDGTKFMTEMVAMIGSNDWSSLLRFTFRIAPIWFILRQNHLPMSSCFIEGNPKNRKPKLSSVIIIS